MTNHELIEAARSVLKPHMEKGRLFGDVGATLLSERGVVFSGVSVDTASWGLCAERSALAAMITAGEYRFQKIVAVWRDPETDALYVLPPCGICREFMRAISEENLNAEILLSANRAVPLRELIPEHIWPKPLEG